MSEELKAVALTAPEPSGWKGKSAADWERFTRHAGLPAVEHMLRQARRDQQAATRAVKRLEKLAAERAAQITAGEWPPPVERVTWRDLRAGDVLADDPDRDVLVEVAETKWTQADGEWTTVWYQVPWSDGLGSRSAPAGREIAIRPRILPPEGTVAAPAAGEENGNGIGS